MLYWELGKMIIEKQTAWGSKFLEQLSQDLRIEFPNMVGFSVTNLKYFRLFYQYVNFRPQAEDPLLLQYFKQIPWGHTKLIINKIKIQMRHFSISIKPSKTAGAEMYLAYK